MSLSNLISSGGKILIVGGFSKAWDSYRKFPALEFWTGEQKDIHKALRDKPIPSNTKAIIISRFISHTELGPLMSDARKRGITMFPNQSDGEVSKLLDEITSETKVVEEKAVESLKRGKLVPLINFINFSETNVENARRLLVKAKELGITTTELSLGQFVGIQRKKKSGVTGVVKSVKNKLDLSVDMLDAMIKDLEGMREFLIAITEENRMLKARLDKFKKAMEE